MSVGAWDLGKKRLENGENHDKEWVSRGLSLGHNKEEKMVLIVDTCLGYTAVMGAKLFSEQERMEEEVRTLS